MNIDIRKSIYKNFTDTNEKEIRDSIESSIQEQDEITLPGLGVFFEIIWQYSDENMKQNLLQVLTKLLVNELSH